MCTGAEPEAAAASAKPAADVAAAGASDGLAPVFSAVPGAAGAGAVETAWAPGMLDPGVIGAGFGGAAAGASALSKVGTTVLGQAAGSAAASLVGKTGVPAVRPAPTLGPTPIMPLQDEQAVANARKKAAAMQATNSGRASTILSQDSSQKLGN